MQTLKKYNLIFFDSFAEARASSELIQQQASESENLYVVIREEGNMDDPYLLQLSTRVKLYAGKAWTSIHERRLAEGWYDEK